MSARGVAAALAAVLLCAVSTWAQGDAPVVRHTHERVVRHVHERVVRHVHERVVRHVHERVVRHALERACTACHGEATQKAGLRLDVGAGMKAVIRPGSAPDSELFRRAALPASHDDAMPPDGPRLSDRELIALLHWINGGPDLDAYDRTAEVDTDRRERASLARATGAVVDGDGEALRIDYSRNLAAVTVTRIAPLADVAGRIIELSLAGTTFDGAALAALPTMPALRRLRFERSSLDDAGLRVVLTKAPAIVELNLHSTRVSPAILDAIRTLPTLERVFLHQTEIGAETARRFAAAHPGLEVVTTATLDRLPFLARGPPRVVVVTDRRIRSFREIALATLTLEWEVAGGPFGAAQAWGPNLIVLEGERTLVERDPRGRPTGWRESLAAGFGIRAFRRGDAPRPWMVAHGVADDRFGSFVVPASLESGIRALTTFRTGIDEKPAEFVSIAADGSFIGLTGDAVWEMDRDGASTRRRRVERSGDDGPAVALELIEGRDVSLVFRRRVATVTPSGEVRRELGPPALANLGLAGIAAAAVLDPSRLLLAGSRDERGKASLVVVDADGKAESRFRVPVADGERITAAWLYDDAENR